jgi:hypothetical protein
VSGATFIRSICILTPSFTHLSRSTTLWHTPELGSEVADLDL